jgi:hypothetical protein
MNESSEKTGEHIRELYSYVKEKYKNIKSKINIELQKLIVDNKLAPDFREIIRKIRNIYIVDLTMLYDYKSCYPYNTDTDFLDLVNKCPKLINNTKYIINDILTKFFD